MNLRKLRGVELPRDVTVRQLAELLIEAHLGDGAPVTDHNDAAARVLVSIGLADYVGGVFADFIFPTAEGARVARCS